MVTPIQKKIFGLGFVVILMLGVILLGATFIMPNSRMSHSAKQFSSESNKEVGMEVGEGIKNLIATGRYKCCLTNPCSYCFTDKEHQDRELVCDCLVDIMNGKAPCGECVGEILEGRGNPLIAEYFATAIAEEIGAKYLSTIQDIITDKYGIPATEQL